MSDGAIAPPLELDQILAVLDATHEKLPVDAIVAARRQREHIVPRLIEALQAAIVAVQQPDAWSDGNGAFFALFLLAEFQAREALPTLLEAWQLPGDLPFQLFGDGVHNVTSRAIVTLADDPPALLDALLRNRGVNQYVRWEVTHGYQYLVRDGRLPRAEAVARLRQILREAIEHKDEEVVDGLVETLSTLAAREAYDDVKLAYERGLADPILMNLEDFEERLAKGEAALQEALQHRPNTAITDTIAELCDWACFQELPPAPPAPVFSPPPTPRASAKQTADWADAFVPLEPLQASGPRAGRNEPCPCGSGKKFKKCCGLRK